MSSNSGGIKSNQSEIGTPHEEEQLPIGNIGPEKVAAFVMARISLDEMKTTWHYSDFVPLLKKIEFLLPNNASTRSVWIASCIYIKRLLVAGIKLAPKNVRPITLVCIELAAKFIIDFNNSLGTFTRTSGVSTLLMTEKYVLHTLDYQLFISSEEFFSTLSELLNL